MAQGEQGRTRITLVESDESAEQVRSRMPGERLVDVDIFVRSPDKRDLNSVAHTARLCSCRQVCIAIIEQ